MVDNQKYYIHCAGGLGDHLVCYFTGRYQKTGFGYLEQLKKEQPHSEVKLITHAVQDQIFQFFRYHPLLSDIEVLRWHNPNMKCRTEKQEAQGYQNLIEFGTTHNWQRRPNKQIYTDKNDKRIIQEVVRQGPFVVLHPFAGDAIRTPLSPNNYRPIVDLIIDQKHYNVVIIGGSYKKLRNLNKPQIKKEKFPYARPGLINLVNKINSRIATSLICRSQMLIATNSGFLCTASRGDIPLIAMSVTARDTESRIRSVFLRSNLISVISMSHRVPKTTNINKLLTEINKRM